ncbi:MAG: alkaline phosphatase D family protein [Halioglobus sp.]|nr:alkaline phosphatase D family protein [Halioglobus sp.]
MPLTRRDFLGLLSASTFTFTALAGARTPVASNSKLTAARFPQGVASGDPQSHSIMLWTRAIAKQPGVGQVDLVLEMSRDETFSEVFLSQVLAASAAADYTVRALITDLVPDTIYFYRFRGGDGSLSRTGRTRTAPAANSPRRVNVAFASCQSYEQAHFGAWARMLEDDTDAPREEQIDFVLHLGDFIYERCWHTRQDGSPQARRMPEFPDGVLNEKNRHAVTLRDYRHLYKVYLSDPHLQAARARWPFVCTWDDHEFSNDCFQSYSTYAGDIRLEPQRKLHANQAWFEYIPAMLDDLREHAAKGFQPRTLTGAGDTDNLTAVNSLRIYRSFRWGQYMDLFLTDTRSYRSPPCLPEGFAASLGLPLNPVALVDIADGGRDYNAGHPPATLPYGDGNTVNPARDRSAGSMLGAEQRAWFVRTLAASSANWKVWGNSLPLLPMRLDLSTLPFTGYEDSIFNIDSWAGFPGERAALMRAVEAQGIAGLVSLSGDHHMHGAGTLNRDPGDAAAPALAADFTVAGISSSPIFEDLLAVARQQYSAFSTLVYRQSTEHLEPVWNMTMLDGVLPAYLYAKTGLRTGARWLGPNRANPGLRYVDTTANGYGLASFDKEELTVRLVTLKDCRDSSTRAPEIHHTAVFRLPLWDSSETPALEGPVFDGMVPFPFATDPV